MARYGKAKSPLIKKYFEEMKYAAGATSIDLAKSIGTTEQTVTNLSTRLDQMSVEMAAKTAKFLGVDLGVWCKTIIKLRNDENAQTRPEGL